MESKAEGIFMADYSGRKKYLKGSEQILKRTMSQYPTVRRFPIISKYAFPCLL
jgi:hypothetical protein